MQKGNLAKSIEDCSWGRFLQHVSYKAENAGKYAIGVDAKGTSQICSNYGTRVPKKQSDRIHNSGVCDIVFDRHLNPSTNILRLGASLQEFSPGMPIGSAAG